MLITLIAWVVLLVVLATALIAVCVFEDVKAQHCSKESNRPDNQNPLS